VRVSPADLPTLHCGPPPSEPPPPTAQVAAPPRCCCCWCAWKIDATPQPHARTPAAGAERKFDLAALLSLSLIIDDAAASAADSLAASIRSESRHYKLISFAQNAPFIFSALYPTLFIRHFAPDVYRTESLLLKQIYMVCPVVDIGRADARFSP
jgi:hypothetical protein